MEGLDIPSTSRACPDSRAQRLPLLSMKKTLGDAIVNSGPYAQCRSHLIAGFGPSKVYAFS